MALTNDLVSKGIFNDSFLPLDVVCFMQSPGNVKAVWGPIAEHQFYQDNGGTSVNRHTERSLPNELLMLIIVDLLPPAPFSSPSFHPFSQHQQSMSRPFGCRLPCEALPSLETVLGWAGAVT